MHLSKHFKAFKIMYFINVDFIDCCVFVLRNNAELVNIDLSALEVIASNGLTFLTENPELCYLGDLLAIITGSNAAVLRSTYRRNSTMCGESTNKILDFCCLISQFTITK